MRLSFTAGLLLSVLLSTSLFAQTTPSNSASLTNVPDWFIVGHGTPGTIPRFAAPFKLADSNIVQSSSGDIGIGTTTPLWPLHVFSKSTTGSQGNPPIAVWAESTAPDTWGGVYAVASSPTGNTIALNGEAYSPNGTGVIGQGGSNGVIGATGTIDAFATGVTGNSQGTSGPGVGVFGQAWSPAGIAGLFINRPGGDILHGAVSQNPDITVFRVDGTGRVFADGGFQPSGADFAESMAVTGDRSKYVPGDLLVIDSSARRRLALAQQPYSTLVAGIYSTKPGMLGSTRKVDEIAAADEVPLAVVGIVPCKVTAENGSISAGDLLVTSSTPGRAMKGTDRSKMLGAVIGKALEPLSSGNGVIQVLVTLQ
jgi:hypothetical protein